MSRVSRPLLPVMAWYLRAAPSGLKSPILVGHPEESICSSSRLETRTDDSCLSARGGFSNRTEVARELDWSQRRGPLTDLPPPPPRGGERRRDFFNDDGKVRDFNNWERRGPLSPVPQPERSLSRDGSRSRNMDRRASPAAWGPGDRHEGSRPPRREFSDRPERQPTAAERDTNWRQSMRPDPPKQSSGESTQAPNSPAPSASQPATRPKLNLAPRTVSAENKDTTAPAPAASSKPNPFGGARPIDTAAREREIEERRAREKREAEERARQERLAREAAAKEAAEKAAAKEAAEKAAAEAAAKANGAQEAATTEAKESPKESEATPSPAPAPAEHKIPIRSREPRDPPKSRATEVSNWRQPAPDRAPSRGGHSGPGPRRGGPRGPRNEGRGGRPNGNAAPQSPSVEQAPSTPIVDEEGWTTVPGKSRRGQSNRPIAS